MHCCDPNNCMPAVKFTARLVAVCQKEQVASFDNRQIPINIDENLIMKLQIDNSYITCNHHPYNTKNKTYETFIQAYEKLTSEELNEALCVSISQIKEYIRHCVPCIGCRTSIENFIKSLIEYHHPGLEPLVMNDKNSITINKLYSSNPENIYTLFYIHGSKLNSFIESIPKSKKNRRCNIHSLDKFRSIHDWEFVWDIMNKECRDEITLVEADCLLDTLENYLCKHRFCMECKLKVLEAYDLLMDNTDYKYHEKRGFCSALYDGLRSCSNDKHIHIDDNKEFLSNLIARAVVEIHDSRRERHAKTLDIAQEEILTCIGIYLFERFDKIYRTIRSEEQTWQLLLYIGIDCLRLNFEKAVHSKQDLSMTLKLLCEDLCINDDIKVQKKRAKRKARRQIKVREEKSKQIDNKEISWEHSTNNKEEILTRRRTTSYSSCLCHFCIERSNSLSAMRTTSPSISLVKSQSCPSSLLFTSESMIKPLDQVSNGIKIPMSSSLETLASSVSTRECVCHESNSKKLQVSCDECPTSVSIPCNRCSSIRTDLGYSSGQDDICSYGPYECSSTICDACLTDLSHHCPLHEENENSTSISPPNSLLSSGDYSHNSYIHNTLQDFTKTIELCDITRKYKVKLQLSHQYPFFNMDLKSIWDENSLSNIENEIFISDEELQQFSMLNKNFNAKRAQLRELFKIKFQLWKQRLPYKI